MSEEATTDSFVEQVFETDMDHSVDMDNSPDSFDDLMSGEEYDSDYKESSEESEDSDTEISSSESEEGSGEAASKDRQDSEEPKSADRKDGEEAGEEGEESEVDDPISAYLKEEEEVKVNGELQKYSRDHILAKGKEMIAGEIVYDKKFTELDVKRKQYQNEVSEVEGYINKFGEIAQTGDVLGALQYFSEFTSIPPYELKQQLINQLVPEVDRLRSMGSAEVQLEYTQQKNEYLEKKYETENQKLSAHQAQMEVQQQAGSLQQTHNIAPSEWSEAEAVLQEHLDDSREITPELVANYVITDRAYAQAESLLDTVDVSLKEDGSVLDEMQRIITGNPGFTEDDLKDIIIQAFGEKQEEGKNEKLVEKVSKNSPKQLKQKSMQDIKPITIDGEEVDDFEDLI